ncbi:MAG: hypothetical protein WD751_11495 [Anaerolineales bacterium]
MPTKGWTSQLSLLAVILLALVLSGCVTYPNPPPTDNPATLTAIQVGFVAMNAAQIQTATAEGQATKSPTPLPPTNTPLPTATPDPCAEMNLTPEECANQGRHQYSITYEDFNGCESVGADGAKEWTVSFSPTSNRGIRQGPNNWIWVNPDSPVYLTISTFSLDGFVEEIFLDGVLGEVSYDMVLCVRTTYKLIR